MRRPTPALILLAGAWVLWLKATSQTSTKWEALSGHATFEACHSALLVDKHLADAMNELALKEIEQGRSGEITMFELQCFPDTIDPRR